MMVPQKFDLESLLDDIRSMYRRADPAHDFAHILRVYKNARIIGQQEARICRCCSWLRCYMMWDL